MAYKLKGQMLQNTEVFRELDAAALTEIAAIAQVREVSGGIALFHQGDAATAFSVLLAGQLKMLQISPEGQQVVLRYIGPGETFGSVAAFCATEYPATAMAVTGSVAAIWQASLVEQLISRHPLIARNVLQVAGQRLRVLQDRYLELATERVERRVAHALLRLIGKAGKKVGTTVSVQFPIRRQDVAEMSGTTLHTASRILSAWEHQGWLEGGRQRIAVRDPEAIARIAHDLGQSSG